MESKSLVSTGVNWSKLANIKSRELTFVSKNWDLTSQKQRMWRWHYHSARHSRWGYQICHMLVQGSASGGQHITRIPPSKSLRRPLLPPAKMSTPPRENRKVHPWQEELICYAPSPPKSLKSRINSRSHLSRCVNKTSSMCEKVTCIACQCGGSNDSSEVKLVSNTDTNVVRIL